MVKKHVKWFPYGDSGMYKFHKTNQNREKFHLPGSIYFFLKKLSIDEGMVYG